MTLDELTQEYCATAAKLAAKIEEHERKRDVPLRDLELMRAMLRDVRTALRCISGYYTTPRSGELDSSSWHARGHRKDDG